MGRNRVVFTCLGATQESRFISFSMEVSTETCFLCFPRSLESNPISSVLVSAEMPLVVICGIPCSGKTARALELAKHFTDSGKKVQLINEESLHITKADGYKGTLRIALPSSLPITDPAKIIFRRRT
jgi:hypothetical protein